MEYKPPIFLIYLTKPTIIRKNDKTKRPLRFRWTSSSVLGTPLTRLIYRIFFKSQVS